MRIQLDSSVEGKWAKAGKDIKDGDRLKLMDAGQVTPSGFKDDNGVSKDQYVFKVMTERKEEFNVAFNRTSRNTLGRGFGTETEDWVGKVVKAFVVKQMIGDGLKNVLYLAPDGWIMSEDGEFLNPDQEDETRSTASVSESRGATGAPKYDVAEADDIAASNPF